MDVNETAHPSTGTTPPEQGAMGQALYAPVAGQQGQTPWFLKTWVLVAAVAAVVIGGGVAIFLATRGGGDAIAAPVTASPSPSESASPSPSAVPFTLLDDGIAEGEYPDAAPSPGDAYPAALAMEDWVWEKVGPMWTLVSVSPVDRSKNESSTAVIYLASPEGVLFDLVHVREPAGPVRVVSWIEDRKQARIETTAIYDDGATTGALVDLVSGAVTGESFPMSTGTSAGERSVGTSADNTELWIATDKVYAESRFEWWSADLGWQRAADDADLVPWVVETSPVGTTAVAEIYDASASGFASPRSGVPGQPNLVVFDFNTRSTSVVRPVYEMSAGWCNLATVTRDGDPVLGCYPADYSSYHYYIAKDGERLAETDTSNLPLAFAITSEKSVVDAVSGLEFVSRTDDPAAYEVKMDVDGTSTMLLAAGDQLPFTGIPSPRTTVAAPGVILVRGGGVCALVDTENAVVSLPVALDIDGQINCVGYGLGGDTPVPFSYYD